ncbi:MAG: hypothetical protein M1836_006291 [Candelina mexicana]|nr:MAG: hypothetical protein M1836_006291 [Candelina mexicana]
MGLATRLFRLPRPKTFLYLMSLRTGTELITLSLLLNKLSGIYGLLALLTGLHLSPLQLSMYIYSVFALILTAFLAPHIRKQSPLQCLALAWFYAIDSVINAAYTAAFAVTWFLMVSQHHSDSKESAPPRTGGGTTIDETAGFTNPKYNVSHVDIVSDPASQNMGGQDAVAVGAAIAGTTAAAPSLGHAVLQSESMSSIVVIALLWAIRLYFVLVVASYARSVLRQHMYTSASTSRLHLHMDGASDAPAHNPFAKGMPDGVGWKGQLGRAMTKVGKAYWLGSEGEEAWARGIGGKFKKSVEASGPVERERRRRSGTGPPLPPQPLRIQELQELR